MRKIGVPTDSVPEFKLGETMAGIQRWRQERETRKREEAQEQGEEDDRREEVKAEETHSLEEGVAEKKAQNREK